jgi:nucleoside-diphosphate-sugar epimerase
MSGVIAVTGATGFIGRHLAARLAARGDRVRAIVRPDSPRPAPSGVDVVRAPLTAEALRPAFDGCDAVVHLAGVVTAPTEADYVAVNVDATRGVADAANRAGAWLVHVSSLAAAGPAPAAHPRVEDDPPRPITTYGITKLAGERAVAATAGLRWTTLRPGVVYGDGDRALAPLVALARSPIVPLVGRPDAAYTFVHVDDMIDATVAALARREDRLVCFVGHAEPVRPRQMFEELQAAGGRRGALVRIPAPVVWTAANVCDAVGRLVGRTMPIDRRRYSELYAEGFVCRVDRLRERLGVVAAIGLRDGLRKSAAWYFRRG